MSFIHIDVFDFCGFATFIRPHVTPLHSLHPAARQEETESVGITRSVTRHQVSKSIWLLLASVDQHSVPWPHLKAGKAAYSGRKGNRRARTIVSDTVILKTTYTSSFSFGIHMYFSCLKVFGAR